MDMEGWEPRVRVHSHQIQVDYKLTVWKKNIHVNLLFLQKCGETPNSTSIFKILVSETNIKRLDWIEDKETKFY
jgi:hypothetical protein